MAGVFAASFRTPDVVVSLFATSWRTAGTAASVVVVSAFWGREVSSGHHPSDGTHVEDLKNLLQVHPPGCNLLFVFLRVETPRNRIPSSPLDELVLDICHGTAIESIICTGSKHILLVQLTPTTGVSHHTRTDRLRPVSFPSSLGRALGRPRRKTTRARHDPVLSPLSPSCV